MNKIELQNEILPTIFFMKIFSKILKFSSLIKIACQQVQFEWFMFPGSKNGAEDNFQIAGRFFLLEERPIPKTGKIHNLRTYQKRFLTFFFWTFSFLFAFRMRVFQDGLLDLRRTHMRFARPLFTLKKPQFHKNDTQDSTLFLHGKCISLSHVAWNGWPSR